MSLATHGKQIEEGDVTLPLIEYDDLDRTTEDTPADHNWVPQWIPPEEYTNGYPWMAEVMATSAKCYEQVVSEHVDRPGWDPGPEVTWGAEHGWGLKEEDIPTFGWDTRRVWISNLRVQTLNNSDAQFL